MGRGNRWCWGGGYEEVNKGEGTEWKEGGVRKWFVLGMK